VSLTANYGGDADAFKGNGSFLVGVGVSVVLHLMLLLLYRGTGPSLPEPEPASSIAVRILPPAPPQVDTPPPPQAAPRVDAAAPRRARKSAPKPVIAVPASPREKESPEAFTVQQPEEPAPASGDTPQFSMDDAKQTARKLAGQTKLGREGTAVAQFPEPPLETESKFAKAISKAKRRNCKDGVPGGLLAPLFLMMDKKDSGCKW